MTLPATTSIRGQSKSCWPSRTSIEPWPSIVTVLGWSPSRRLLPVKFLRRGPQRSGLPNRSQSRAFSSSRLAHLRLSTCRASRLRIGQSHASETSN